MRERRDVRATRGARGAHHNRQSSGIFPPIRGIRITVPVTLCLIVAHLVVFLMPAPIRKLLPSSTGVCGLSLHDGVVRNILYSTIKPLLHARISHLIYDITLLLWSGLFLERSMGSMCFAMTLPILGIFSEWLRFVVNSQLGTFFSHLNTSECIVGFSATLFALKVILEKQYHMCARLGLPMPLRMSTWVVLFALYASVPETSTTGNICGILAGYVFVYLNSGHGAFQSAAVTIRQVLSNVTVALEQLSTYKANRRFHYQNGRCQKEGTDTSVGSGDAVPDNLEWSCQSCSRKNGVFLSCCDFCGTPRSPTNQFAPSAPLWQEDDRLGYLLS